MSYKYLDLTGLSHFWDKIKAKIPTKTSQLTNDSYFNYSSEVTGGTIDALAAFTSGKPGLTGSISLATKSSGVGSEIPAGWYNYYFAPHRSGVGGDNGQYGTIILTPMNFAGASWILRRSNSTAAITEVKKITTADQLSNYIINSNSYINTHPENSPVLIPFINNDIAFLLKRGGSAKLYYDGVEQTNDMSAMFDACANYWNMNPTGITEVVVELTLHKVFAWSNTIYCDHGNSSWRAKNIKIEVMNSNYAKDVWTTKLNITNNGSGNVKVNFNHTPVGASNAGGGFNKIRFTFSGWNNSTIFRIAQLGVYNHGSLGSRETSMSRGVDDYVFRNITPNNNNAFNLGDSSHKWANVYATTFQGNATSATKATQDSDGNQINTTYYKASNPNGYTSNTGTITGIKMNGASKGTSGVVDLGTVITAHQDISGKQDKLTNQTAYSAKGSATKVPQITTNTLGQVTRIAEVTITQPTVNNGTLTIQKNGTSVGTFTANQSGNSTANITVPTKTTDLTNDSGFIESEDETVANIVSLTKEEYDALDTKTPNTLYNIIDDYEDNVPTAIPDSAFTIGTGTLETNHSYKNGKAVTLNFSIRTSTTAGRTLVLLTLPSGYYPTGSAVACFATVNGTLVNSWIRNQNGDVCVVTPATLTNIEIKLITTYIV